MDFWIKAAQLILSLSLLIVLHEFGHFIPARLFKTRVEKFYLFFNPYFSLFKKKIGETEWGIGWLPLGGYVKIAGMVDESMDTEQLAQPPQPWEFRSKPAWQRLIIMIGGVFVNVIVGFGLFIMISAIWGEEKINQRELIYGIAVHPYFEQYGLHSGDVILSVDGKRVDQVSRIGGEILLFGKRHFKVRHQDGTIETIHLPEDIGSRMWENGAENAFDIRAYFNEVKSVDTNYITVRKLGLKPGDRFLTVGGNEFEYYDQFQKLVYDNRGKNTEFSIVRGDDTINKTAYIRKEAIIGFKPDCSYTTDTNAIYHVDYSLGESFGVGISKGWKTLYGNVVQFKYVFTKKGAGQVGGFGAIGKLFPATWNWEAFWGLTAFISIALAFMNILPIPALDGGHVMFLLYEMITGRQPAQRVMEIAQYCGFILLIGLLLYANGNDLLKLFSGS
jgi:regulator of sigma E protease